MSNPISKIIWPYSGARNKCSNYFESIYLTFFSTCMCISYLCKNIITTKLPYFTSKLFCFYWVKNELCKNLLINNSQQYVIIYLSASNVYFQNRSQILTNKLQIQFWFHYQKQIILLIISVPGIPIVINNLNICESK